MTCSNVSLLCCLTIVNNTIILRAKTATIRVVIFLHRLYDTTNCNLFYSIMSSHKSSLHRNVIGFKKPGFTKWKGGTAIRKLKLEIIMYLCLIMHFVMIKVSTSQGPIISSNSISAITYWAYFFFFILVEKACQAHVQSVTVLWSNRGQLRAINNIYFGSLQY